MNEQREPEGELPEGISEEELLAQLERITVDDVVLQTVVTLVNVAGRKLTAEPPDAEQGRRGIDVARALLPFCPEDQVGPIREALSQLQMLFVRATQEAGGPPPEAPPQSEPEQQPEPQQKPESRLWTPPGSSTS